MVELLPLNQIAAADVEALLDRAFGADRHARTAYRLREAMGVLDALSFAAMREGAFVGSIQCWPVALHAVDRNAVPLVMVGPVAVHPDVQRGGIGRALCAASIAAAEQNADGALMMIGDPEYYGRWFGFSADATGAWDLPGPFEPRRLLARAANGHVPPALAGIVGPR